MPQTTNAVDHLETCLGGCRWRGKAIDKHGHEPTDQIKKSSALEFIPGIIVRFGVNDPIDDEKKIKQRIRAAVMENVNYVDAKIGANEYFVRCAHSDQAKTLSNAKILGNAEILSGMLISFVFLNGRLPEGRK